MIIQRLTTMSLLLNRLLLEYLLNAKPDHSCLVHLIFLYYYYPACAAALKRCLEEMTASEDGTYQFNVSYRCGVSHCAFCLITASEMDTGYTNRVFVLGQPSSCPSNSTLRDLPANRLQYELDAEPEIMGNFIECHPISDYSSLL
jgi:hypothetical protein